MKKVFLIGLVLMLVSVDFSLPARKRSFEKIKCPPLNKIISPEIQKTGMKNGIKIRLIENNEVPLVHLNVFFKGGRLCEPPGKTGISTVIIHALRNGGTGNLKTVELEKLLDSKGIRFSISSDLDYFYMTIICLRESIEEAIFILSQVIRFPKFDMDEINEIKTRLKSRISRRNDRPEEIILREFDKLIYGTGHPIAAAPGYNDIDNISLKDITSLYNRVFAPDNMLAGVTGHVESDYIKRLFEKYFGDWRHRADIPSFPAVHPITKNFRTAFIDRPGIKNCYILIGHSGKIYNPGDRAKLMMFNQVFSVGATSRLFKLIRSKLGLTYSINGGIFNRYLYPGKVYFSTSTGSDRLEITIKTIMEEIVRIREENVAPGELENAKHFFLNSFVFRFSSGKKILFNHLERELYNLEAEDGAGLMEEIKMVTGDDIRETAQKYLKEDGIIILVLGDEKKLAGQLDVLGKIKKIDISII